MCSVQEYFLFKYNIGGILSVMEENGAKVFDASYDAWGKQTVTLNSIGLHRGYTGHEMLSEFDIIYMNQRSLSLCSRPLLQPRQQPELQPLQLLWWWMACNKFC